MFVFPGEPKGATEQGSRIVSHRDFRRRQFVRRIGVTSGAQFEPEPFLTRIAPFKSFLPRLSGR